MGTFDELAAKVGSKRLAGYITTHNPKVRARAEATRARHAAAKKKRKKKTSTEMSAEKIMSQLKRR